MRTWLRRSIIALPIILLLSSAKQVCTATGLFDPARNTPTGGWWDTMHDSIGIVQEVDVDRARLTVEIDTDGTVYSAGEVVTFDLSKEYNSPDLSWLAPGDRVVVSHWPSAPEEAVTQARSVRLATEADG